MMVKSFELLNNNCWFYYPIGEEYILVHIKDNIIYVGEHWKEIRLFDDGYTNLIENINLLCHQAYNDLN